jgi:hypothetical protein
MMKMKARLATQILIVPPKAAARNVMISKKDLRLRRRRPKNWQRKWLFVKLSLKKWR